MNMSTTANPMKAPTRERTMTGETISSIGSFATYFGQDAISDNEPCQDTFQDVGRVMPVTPVFSDMADQDDDIPLEQQVQRAKCQPSDALDALDQVMEGIRIITRQMKRSHMVFQEEAEEQPFSETTKVDTQINRERSWSDSCCSTIQSCASDDDLRLSALARQLEGTIGADLMGLAHAAQMVGENSRMASQEASQSVHDVHMAHESIQQADLRVKKAESAVRIMYKKQKELIGQLEKAKNERNVLKRQVKALLKEKAVMKEQEHVVKALELHVVSALQAHESQLALQQAKRKEENKEDSGNVATVRLECPSQDEDGFVSTSTDGTRVNEEHFAAAAKLTTETKNVSFSDESKKAEEPTSKAISDAGQDEETSTGTSVFAAAQQAPESKSSTFVGAAQEAGEAKDKSLIAAAQEKENNCAKAAPARNRGGLGFGFGGSFRKLIHHLDELETSARPPVPTKKSEPKQKKPEKKEKEIKDTKAQEPALISPTNSVEESSAEGSSEQQPTSAAEENKISVPLQGDSSDSTTEASITTDGISPCNQASLISPSPTESAGLTKGRFFHHRSNKEQTRRPNKPVVGTKKPLLHLDDESVDATEGSHDCTFTSDTIPASESFSTASGLSCDVHATQVPPLKSLSCDVASQISPFSHDCAATVLDEKAFRSLALPAFVGPSQKNGEKAETMTLDATALPPELAEIAEIYAEIGQLHEC